MQKWHCYCSFHFRKKDFLENGSYWRRFNNKICLRKNSESNFMVCRFTILQNIDDRLTMNEEVKIARDPVSFSNPADDAKLHKCNNDEYLCDESDVPPKMSEFSGVLQ